MADIAMCANNLCPAAGHCFRVQARLSYYQSWQNFDYTVGPDGVICEHFMPAYKQQATDRTGAWPST